MIRRVCTLGLAAVLGLAACADEELTGVGGELLDGGTVNTFEVLVPASRFLEMDTTVTGFSKPADAFFVVIADDFGGEVDARGLVRFRPPPATVEYEDSAGNSQTDADPTFVGGDVVVVVDSVRSAAAGPVELKLYRTAEAWDAGSATWTLRTDTGAVELPWTEPGGTTDALVSSVTWQPGQDTVRIPVDSQTVALWADTDNAARGALLVAEGPGSRLFSSSVSLRLDARPSARPDTVVAATAAAAARTFIYDPPVPATGALRVSGLPAWRSYLEFRDRLDTLAVQVVDDGDTVTARLDDLTLNYAALVLRPDAGSGGFVPEDSVNVQVRQVLGDRAVPLARSPVTRETLGDVDVAPDVWAAASPDAVVELPLTPFLKKLVAEGEPEDDEEVGEPRVVTLMTGTRTFGVASFVSPTAEDEALQLRLILTVATEVGIQ